MKNTILVIFGITVFICTPQLFAGVWTDPFDSNKLIDGWEFRDRREKVSTVTVKDGFLRLTNPTGNWGHMTADKPMLERDVPKTAQDLIVSGLFSSEPDKPTNAWIGMFIFGDDQMDFACLLFGGESNQPQKCLIGSMIKGAWNDKGHFQTGADVPLYLKLEKAGKQFTGYFRTDQKKDWNKIGNTWEHQIKEVKKVGLGFINNWGGKTVILLVDTFSIDGEGIRPLSVTPSGKLTTVWGALKQPEQ